MRNEVAAAVVAGWLGMAAGAAAQTLYQEEDGVVAMEVESAPPTGSWKPETAMEGFTGKCYYTWRGGNQFRSPGSGVLSYTFLVTQSGEYRLAIRNRHDFHDSTEQNDCFTSMDGGKWTKTFSSQRGQWTWRSNHEFNHSDKPPAKYHLTAGAHTLRLSGRSSGFSIDRIHLYREGARGATDENRPESAGLPVPPQIEHLEKVLAAWQAGHLGSALQLAERSLQSEDAAAAAEAEKCVAALKAFAEQQKAKIEDIGAQDPVMAADLLALLARRYQPSTLGKELAAEAGRRARDPAVAKERKARAMLQQIQAVAGPLVGKGKADDPKFARRHYRQLSFIAAGVAALKKKYPESKACAQAEALAEELGIPLDR